MPNHARCWQVRSLNRPVVRCAPILEQADFWKGSEVEQRDFSIALRSSDISAVVLPSRVEINPRRLLHAIAAGIPVIASAACGLEGVEGVTSVPGGDLEALRDAVDQFSKSSSPADQRYHCAIHRSESELNS